jgi:glycosyltransferase involved in cell wall biosynthesis
MISFIVIGLNEGRKLRKCFESIYKSIEFNKVMKYEIIYVDSKSTDNSIQVAQEFEEINIYYINGKCNAAIGRNVGAKEAKGTILFFIDADMEISKDFLAMVLDKNLKIKYNLVTGIVVDYVDGIENIHRLDDDEFLSGGIFIIKKEIWDTVKGMKTKYKTGENADLGLRLIKIGFPIIRIPEIITKHHTVPYLSKSRIWKMTWDKSKYYSRCVLYRDHIFNKHMYPFLWKNDKTFILLSFIIVASFIFTSFTLLFITVYLVLIGIRSCKQVRHLHVAELFLYFIIFDILNIFYFIIFFPTNHKETYYMVNKQKIATTQTGI